MRFSRCQRVFVRAAAAVLALGVAASSVAAAKPRPRPYVIDTCHAWAADGPVVKRWAPDFYSGPDAEAVRAAAAGKDLEEMED